MQTQLQLLLTCLEQAAVVAEKGELTCCNGAARQLGLQAGMKLAQVLPPEMRSLDDALEVSLPDFNAWATVVRLEQMQVLLLHPNRQAQDRGLPERIAATLRRPLTDFADAADALLPRLEGWEDELVQRQAARMLRSYYRLLRTVCNLSQLDVICDGALPAPRVRTELTGLLARFHARAESLTAECGCCLITKWPSRQFYGDAAPEVLERALLNLLSNAIRYSPAGSEIHVELQQAGNHARITVRNPGAPMADVSLADVSTGYLRPLEPGMPQQGLGLGISVARSAARLHEGVLLLQSPPEGGLIACLSFPLRAGPDALGTGRMHVDPYGGFDPYLVELSDVLPDDVFDSRNL